MYNLIFGIRVVCAIVMYIMVVVIFFSKEKSKEHSVLQIIMAFMYIFTIVMVFQLRCETEEAALLILQLREVCIYCIVVMVFYFVVCCTGNTPGKFWTVLLTTWSVIANIGILFFFRKDGMFLNDVRFVEDEIYLRLTYSRGVWGHIYETLIVVYALLILWQTIVYMGRESKSRSEDFRKKALLGAILLPELFYTTYHFKFHRCYELIIIGFTAAAATLLYASWRYRVFDVVTSTKDMMLENLDQGMVIYNEHRKLLYANQVAKQLLAEIDTFVQQNPEADTPPQNGDFRKGGREYEIHGNVIFHEEQLRGYSYYILDVTVERMQIQEAYEARSEAEEANEAKSNFLASVSHELRTPLNGIIGMSEIALRSELKAENRFQVKSILHSATNMLMFINNLLDLSKIESNMLELSEESYSVEQNVFEAMNVVNMSLGQKPIHLEAHIAPEVPGRLLGDTLRIQHILLNLLSNAVKYTKEGKVILKVYGEEKPEGYELHMDVTDTGVGIRPEQLEEIFWSYNQGDWKENREANGTGLGLTITKNLVECMGGAIRVESEVNKGSTFFVTVMQQIDVWEEVETTLLTSEMLNAGFGEKYLDRRYQYTFEGAKVLIVDDINTNLLVAQGLLEPYELQVKCVLSADEAIEEIRQHGEEYQLVFMDYMMPEKNGIDAIKEIKEEQSDLTIVAMSADVSGNMKQFFVKNGFTDYISKPVNRQKLETILLRYLSAYKKGTNFYAQIPYGGELEGLDKTYINVSEGFEQNGRNIRNYCLVLSTYEKEMKAILPTLAPILEENVQELCTKVHGIRGSSRAIGAEHAGVLAGKLEDELKQELVKHTYSKEHLSKSLERLEREVKKVVLSIGKFMETDQAIMYLTSGTIKQNVAIEKVKAEKGMTNSSFDIHAWYEKLERALNGYDAILAEHLIRELRPFANEIQVQMLENLQEGISLYDYAACKKILSEYKNR